MRALCTAFGIHLEEPRATHIPCPTLMKGRGLNSGVLWPACQGRDLALLCQVVENRVVGAPCGIMDQMASALGREGQLLALQCRPAEACKTPA